jgi:hypothetical protein
MRLLNSCTLEFQAFYDNVPPYAILSHTWGRQVDEVTFQDLRDGTGTNKPGYKKVKDCCAQAVRDGLDYAWVDTCCIDKTNSVELQEAINSMFNWYKRSTICYAYLPDVHMPTNSRASLALLRASSWFTRGWTLQELIAPAHMVFYDYNWRRIDSKAGLKNLLSTITGVNPSVLEGEDLELSSIAQRMSWASTRKTTRAEDMAYCLLGIFKINIPLIYGEGAEEAFIRLQKGIIEKSDDHSLFAWKQQGGPACSGLLASSPAHFIDSRHIKQVHGPGPKNPYTMTNRGLCLQLSLACDISGGVQLAELNCMDAENRTRIGLYLSAMQDGRFIRTQLDQLPLADSSSPQTQKRKRFETSTIYIPELRLSQILAEREFRFRVLLSGPQSIYHRAFIPAYTTVVSTLLLPLEAITYTFGVHRALALSFSLSTITSSGRQIDSRTSKFKLGLGGIAGVLLRGSQTWQMLFPESCDFVVVFFGVDLNGTVYGGICDPTETHGLSGRSSETDQTKWLENFLRHYKPSSRSRSFHRLVVANFKFTIEIKRSPKRVLAGESAEFGVLIDYHRMTGDGLHPQ